MKKLLSYLKPYRIVLFFVLLAAVGQSVADLYLPNIMSDIVDVGIQQGDTKYILEKGGFMLLIALAGGACSVLLSFLASKTSSGVAKTLRHDVFEHVEEFSLSEFNNIGTSSLITRSTNDINQIQQVIVMILRMAVAAPIMLVGSLFMALSKDVPLSLTFAVAIPIVMLILGIVSKFSMPLFKSMQKKIDAINRVVREGLMGIRVVRAFNRTEYEEKRFDDANLDLTNTAIRVNKIMAVMMPLMMFLFNVLAVAIIWFGAKRIDIGEMQVGDLMAFIQYTMQVMMSVVMVAMIFIMVPRAQASVERVGEVLELEPVIKESSNTIEVGDSKGYLEFKNVTFKYPRAEEPVLSNISFSAKPGETTAIIGSTGSGKSALVNLIPRFYDIESGEILVDGLNIKDMRVSDLRKRIGFVPQKSILFSGTIEDNIKYGKLDATKEEVVHAAETAQAADFISKMKDGYDSIIDQGGNNVSGGQKQRLAIARALVRRPEIYVFDDSFSALDFKTDAKLRKALSEDTKGSTVVIVAQRVSTVMNADRIIVLDEGKVCGIGKHKELLETCNVYKEIVLSQLSEEEIS